IASVPIPPGFRQAILEADDLTEQFRVIGKVLLDETEILSIRQDIDARLQQTLEKNQKDYVLREQMKTIRSELGEGTEEEADVFLKKTEELTASEEIKKAIRNEIRRFQNMGQSSSEGQVIRSYIETLLALPWDKTAEDSTDLKRAEEILERDHYGLTKIKERIMEFLAVKERISNAEAPILCLVGPPGTGKTSIAKSIAEAMNRPYVRVCLGGVRDEAEIRGHRRTYVASMPGRIVNGLKQAGVKNPLMLLDELDKLGSDYKGDPSAALLEVLDSAQNSRFIDHYVDLPVDLSNIVFIATANTTDTIPRPLLDRVEVLELDSYTENEKVHIAKGYLVPKQLKAHGITAKEVAFSEAAIRDMIRFYTREAGVRELERVIGKVCRKVIRKHAGEENPGKENVSRKNLTDYLGIYRYHDVERVKKPQVGIARGLAWTAVGGTTLEIEVNALKGTGRIGMTGRLGEVMQESASAGISYIRSVADRYSLPEDYFEKHDIFIHIPEGAVPKDGPSAGITIATAVLSAVTGIPVDSELAMTGEITMRGRVLPIGGLKEKMLAAKKVGINKILVPDDNREDVSEISEEIREGMDIRFVTDMGQVLNEAFVR
ncbi:MAG: endopeptidase La, partial [Lachnospiraceae bacterium]|nr:endopeptidase La [Lachnospiraceae bacterium]